jgi:hypothetical protein
MAKNARYAAEMSCFVEYWERIHREITGPLPIQPDNLQEGFWPMSDWRRDHAWRCSTDNGPVYTADNSPKDDLEPYPFCGPAKDRSRPNFNPYHDVLLGDFVLCRPSHNNHLPVWLGRALTCVDNTPGDNYGRFTVKWWTPMKGKREGKRALARECWTRWWEKELRSSTAPLSSSRTGFLPIENPVRPRRMLYRKHLPWLPWPPWPLMVLLWTP